MKQLLMTISLVLILYSTAFGLDDLDIDRELTGSLPLEALDDMTLFYTDSFVTVPTILTIWGGKHQVTIKAETIKKANEKQMHGIEFFFTAANLGVHLGSDFNDAIIEKYELDKLKE